jgi:hypothetical protein
MRGLARSGTQPPAGFMAPKVRADHCPDIHFYKDFIFILLPKKNFDYWFTYSPDVYPNHEVLTDIFIMLTLGKSDSLSGISSLRWICTCTY